MIPKNSKNLEDRVNSSEKIPKLVYYSALKNEECISDDNNGNKVNRNLSKGIKKEIEENPFKKNSEFGNFSKETKGNNKLNEGDLEERVFESLEVEIPLERKKSKEENIVNEN